jgi:hypothetical protein
LRQHYPTPLSDPSIDIKPHQGLALYVQLFEEIKLLNFSALNQLYPVRKYHQNNIIKVLVLLTSIAVANSFIIFTSDEDRKFYFAKLTTTVTSGVAFAIALLMVYKYKIKEHQFVPHQFRARQDIMHSSICIFLGIWFVAQLIWSFYDQQSPAPSVADILWLIGYVLFGYFLYSLLYISRKELEAHTFFIVASIVTISLTYIVIIILSVSSLLTFQKQDISVTILTIAYPILDAILLVPALLIFRIRRNPVTFEHRSDMAEQQEDISWILLSLSIILFAIADTGFAYITALNLMMVQKEVWIWNIFYNSGYILLAGALTGYSIFFAMAKSQAKEMK